MAVVVAGRRTKRGDDGWCQSPRLLHGLLHLVHCVELPLPASPAMTVVVDGYRGGCPGLDFSAPALHNYRWPVARRGGHLMRQHTQNQAVHRPLVPPALYYPYADFQSEEWVKLALLNWPKIRRIKPEGYPHEDSVATLRIRDLLPDWLIDVTPNAQQLEDVAQRFYVLLRSCGPRLRERYAVDKRYGWPSTRFGNAPPGADERLAYVLGGDEQHAGKFAKHLPAALGNLVLAHRVGEATWYGFHPRLASVYMCALTEVIADTRGLVPVTDNEKVHRNARRSTLDRLEQALTGGPQAPPEPSREEEVESQYFEIALKSVLNPVNLDEFSIDRVIDFRGNHKEELEAFQDHVFGLRTDILRLCQISDREELKCQLQDIYKQRTEPELKDLQEKLRRFGIRSITGVLKLRIDEELVTPTIGGFLAEELVRHIDPHEAGIAVSSGIAVAAITYFRRRRQERERLQHESPASLLLAVQRELAS